MSTPSTFPLLVKAISSACEALTASSKEAKKRGSKSVVNREVVRLVTAGTLTEEPLLDAKKNNFLMSLSKVSDVLGIAWLDISTGEFKISKGSLEEIFDNNYKVVMVKNGKSRYAVKPQTYEDLIRNDV